MRNKRLFLAIGLACLAVGCASDPKKPDTKPLLVAPKKNFWDGWGDSLAANSSKGNPAGSQFKFDGKANK